MIEIVTTLSKISAAPSDDKAFRVWLEQKDALSLLAANIRNEDLVIYATFTHAFMHVVLVPESLVNPPDVNDLMSWQLKSSSTWGISCDFLEPSSVFVSAPLDHTESKTIDQGEQLVFTRSFEGRLGDKHYIEIAQRLAHLFDLHLLTQRNAYCRLDRHGDIDEVIRIMDIPEGGELNGGTFVIIRRDILDEYMVLTEGVAVLMFDFPRARLGGFNGWRQGTDADLVTAETMSYRLVHQPGYCSDLRGYQLVRPRTPKETIVRRLRNEAEEEEGQYATFIIQDLKNLVVTKVSCGPGHTAKSFTESDLPPELSPAFFRSEVLSKYKADSDKYSFNDRSISCRGSWHLEAYDINEAGQVHAYLVDLRRLPHEEQIHWTAYNERPKGPISKRAFTTDIEGRWNLEYDPLDSLKTALDELRRRQVPWWTLRSHDLPEQVHYPVTSSTDEWSIEILRLDKFVVEGFEQKWLRKKALELGRTPEPKVGSLKLVEECLIALGFEEDHAAKITGPLHEVHSLRSKLIGHASGSAAVSIKQRVLSEHGSYRKHFHALCGRCDESIQTIVEAFKDFRDTPGNRDTQESG
jgi:hypothetical protein